MQEEFFHTFNTLYEAGKQIVLSSDRPPRDLATLEARLRSRFEWGLITDVQPPDLETRIAILRKKVHADGIAHPRPAGADLHRRSRLDQHPRARGRADARRRLRVAHRPADDGRPRPGGAEGPLPAGRDARGLHRADPGGRRRALRDLARRTSRGDKRTQSIVYPRQVAMYLSRELTDCSLPKIGKKFGGRDHTTVMHATSKIAKLIRKTARSSTWSRSSRRASSRPVDDLWTSARQTVDGLPSHPNWGPRRFSPDRVPSAVAAPSLAAVPSSPLPQALLLRRGLLNEFYSETVTDTNAEDRLSQEELLAKLARRGRGRLDQARPCRSSPGSCCAPTRGGSELAATDMELSVVADRRDAWVEGRRGRRPGPSAASTSCGSCRPAT